MIDARVYEIRFDVLLDDGTKTIEHYLIQGEANAADVASDLFDRHVRQGRYRDFPPERMRWTFHERQLGVV